MDLDDIDKPTEPPARQPRFAPKLARKKPTPKLDPTQSESISAPVIAVKTEKMDVDVADEIGGGGGGDDVVMKEEVNTASMSNVNSSKIDTEPKEAVVEDDYVVAEYDVYFTPPNSDSQLYVMQYPLRPSWRPYELDQRCTEVRVKPNNKEVEMDLSIEMESEHYEPDAPTAEKMQRQTLSSSGRSPQVAAYAVGLLKGKKLYLNPIDAVVQLRPSMAYLDFVDTKKKTAVKVEGSNNNTVSGPSRKQNNPEEKPQPPESWIPLKYHSSASDVAQTYLRKMVTEEGNPMQFSMNPYDYLNSLCPGAVINKAKSNGLSRRSMLSLPLEERLKKLFVEGPHIQRFNAIKHLAPDDPIEDVLNIVQQHANLVQGVWVAKSNDRYSDSSERRARDYALFLFTQNPVMKDSELDILGHRKSVAKTVIREIAVERQNCKDWKFKEPTDMSFIKLYPDIVEHQRKRWQEGGTQLLEKLATRGVGLRRPGPSVHVDEGLRRPTNESLVVGRATNEARSVSTSMSNEAREALSKFLEKLFQFHKVCSFQAIRQGLRDTAVSVAVQPKAGAKVSAFVAAVKNVVDAPQEELQAIISEYTVNVHGVYVLKSSSEQPELNQLRNDIIELFRGREAGAKLKKGEIMGAAQNKPATSEFQKVINDYCKSKGGAWVLKSGDEFKPDDWKNILKAAKLL